MSIQLEKNSVLLGIKWYNMIADGFDNYDKRCNFRVVQIHVYLGPISINYSKSWKIGQSE